MTKKENEYVLRWAKKIKALSLLGNKCIKCGERRIPTFDFHHYCGKKSYAINDLEASRWSEIEKELEKCQLLCANCHGEQHSSKTTKYYKIKQKLLEIKGTSHCSECNYNGISLDFHHEKNKKFELSGGSISLERQEVLDELEKCKVLCRNCHRIHHFDEVKFNKFLPEINKRITTYEELQPEIDRDLIFFCMNQGLTKKQTSVKLKCAKSTVSMAVKAVENMIDKNESIEKIAEIARVDQKLIEAYIPIYNKNKEILNTKTKCLVCGKNTNRKKSTTCSKECFYSHLARNIPSKEVLIELRKTNTIQKIAEKYGVSQPAVSIWIRRYNMKTRCLNSVQPNVNQ